MGQVTIGSETYDIYGTAAEALTYLASSTTGQSWAGLTTDNQNIGLVSATRLFERTTWVGNPTAAIQALEWPRTGIVDRNGVALVDSAIPQDVIDAGYELANIIATTTSTVQAGDTNQKIKRLREKVGDLEVETEFFGATSRGQPRFPTVVDELIGLWLEGNQAVALGTATGSGCTTDFGSDAFGYTGPGFP